MKVVSGVAALAFLLAGCHTVYEELPTSAEQPSGRPAGTPLPIVVTPVPIPSPTDPSPTPTPTPGPGPTPAPTATPTPNPNPTPTPTPEPTPTPPSENCAGLAITIGGSCGGATPECGISNPKDPVAKVGSKVTLDSSYYIGSPGNKVHYGDACYPGPIDYWDLASGVKCGDPFSNNHVIGCGPFKSTGSFHYQACGAGLCGSITVTIR